MPKLPPDEKLFTSEQLAEFQNPCDSCGQSLGVHKAGTRQCPAVPPLTGWRPTTFRLAGTTNFESPVEPLEFGVGSTVKFGARNPESGLFLETFKIGTVVEVVPAGQLPTTKELRHISDKRRTPKSRDVVSYVVQHGNHGAPSRSNLYWPNTFGLESV